MNHSRNDSRYPSRNASPVHSGDDDRSPSPLPRTSRAAHYQPLDAKYPDSVRAPSISRGYSDSSPDFFSSRLVRASARDKSVERKNGSGDNGNRRRSELISSRASSIEPNARSVHVKPWGEVLHEVVKAVVVPHQRPQPTGILQPVPEAPTKFSSKPEAICREIRSCLPEAIRRPLCVQNP